MANGFKNKIEELKLSIERMSSRERVMVGSLGAVVLFLLVFGVGYLLLSGVEETQERNRAMRQALKDVARYKERYLEYKRAQANLRQAMPAAALELNTYVEKAASAVGVKIDESSETSPVETAHFIQRGLQIKLRKLTMAQLATLLKKLESSLGQPVQVTELSVNTRWRHHEELDVVLVVTTYEQNKATAKTARAKKGGRS